MVYTCSDRAANLALEFLAVRIIKETKKMFYYWKEGNTPREKFFWH